MVRRLHACVCYQTIAYPITPITKESRQSRSRPMIALITPEALPWSAKLPKAREPRAGVQAEPRPWGTWRAPLP